MKKRVITDLFFVVLLIAAFFILSFWTDKGLKKLRDESYGVWNDIYDSKINADVIFMGSSRTYINISPAICDSVLKMDTYNLGLDGWDFSMQKVRFDVYRKHNRLPSIIVQNIDFLTLRKRPDFVFHLQFLPYLDDDLIYNGCKGYNGEFDWRDRYVPLYKYIGKVPLIVKGIRAFFTIKKSKKRVEGLGSNLNDIVWQPDAFSHFQSKYPYGVFRRFDSELTSQFESYVAFCKQNGIKMVFDFAPIYKEEMPLELSSPELMKVFKRIADKYQVPILDYSSDSLSMDKKYFYNSQHLNKTGALIFSAHLASDIKKLIEEGKL